MGEHAVSLIDGTPYVTETLVDVVDPFTGQSIGSTHESGSDAVHSAVRSATEAFQDWSRTSVDDRAAVLERAADLLDERGSFIASTVTREMGMPTRLSQVTQSQLPASVLRAAAATARAFPWIEDIDGAQLRRRASGVVGAITPWNMPVHQIVAKVSAALGAGCTVVLKPSEATPFDAVAIAQIFLDAGLPRGAFNVVQGTGAVTGSALASHPGIAHVSFTGSVGAGRTVAALAAGSLARTTLELGGKSPAVILPDADLDVAVAGALGSALVNSGQACNAPTRMVIPSHMAGEIERRIAEATFVLGDPSDPATTHGPLASKRQLDRVVDYAQSALADGGRLVVGTGKPEGGCFMAPTVIADLPPTARAVREEIFGPVVVLQTYGDVDEAVRIANDSDFGLSAEVWGDPSEAKSVASKLHVGQVKVNGVRTRERPAVPFGGIKQSGYGRELGALGFSEFTDVTAVMA
ncbi:aldehyde dehydrogenase family protein [Rhodococcoides kyotonense]|uniref:aldehyde dehydrogenase (NAD(+)) n=1 Tax=Rhodococcoides kyotonense TaxID=398843 RepID=A0A239ISX9_9NOCA|nr:aldehyde dehydrogenase family protein [Rhodococcus kyotonensis]SNS96740.1 aldehyde dehydrogenase (NAD+)/betaine-aldehyde dehydrogenase [Rhodococcus kyotonensis]